MTRQYPTLKEVFLPEISKIESRNFFRDIKQRDPELYKELDALASVILQLGRADIKPKKASDTLEIFLNKHRDVNPMQTGDTLGVKMFIDNLASSAAEARGAKQYYDNIYNALLKDKYKKLEPAAKTVAEPGAAAQAAREALGKRKDPQ